MNRIILGSAALAGGLLAAVAGAAEYQANWGPAVGAPLPALSALDQRGVARDFASLGGKRGLLLFVNRSADW